MGNTFIPPKLTPKPVAQTNTATRALSTPLIPTPLAHIEQPAWARNTTPGIDAWDAIFPTAPTDDPTYALLLANMGVPPSDIAAMNNPTIKHIVQMLAADQQKGPHDGQLPETTTAPKNREAPVAQSEDERPPKRIRPSNRESKPVATPTVNITFSKPPTVHVINYGDEPDVEVTKRNRLIAEALRNVKARLDGASPETEAPDFVKPCNKTVDNELHTYLDYDQGISSRPESGNETSDALRARIRLNKHIWNTFRLQYEADTKRVAIIRAEAKGYMLINGRFERPNDLYNVGYIYAPVFWYRDTNTVFYGDYTGAVIRHIQAHTRITFEAPEEDPIYRAVPGGYPQTMNELKDLILITKNGDIEGIYRVGTHIMLRSFYEAAGRIHASLRDTAMRGVLLPDLYNPDFFLSFLTSANVHLPFDVMPPMRKGRGDGANDGFGLGQPYDMFNVVEWGIYFLVHHPVGSENRINGLNMDFGGRIRLENLYTYLFVRALRPSHKHSRALARYTTLFAHLAARPHLYEERIDEYNQRHPDAPFRESEGLTFTFAVSDLLDNAANNFTSINLSDHLISNGVPVRVVHHAYSYGRQFLDQTFFNVGQIHESRLVNAERVERLQRFGTPPTIPEWTGWYAPAHDVIRRIKYIYHSAPQLNDLNNLHWTVYGAEHSPGVLASDPHKVPIDVPIWDGSDHSVIDDKLNIEDTESRSPQSDALDEMNAVTDASLEVPLPESPLTDGSVSDDDMDGDGEPDDED